MNRRKTIFAGLIVGVSLVGAVLILLSNHGANSAQRMPGADAIITNMTAFPQLAPLTGAMADELNSLKTMVEACAEYRPQRHDQMEQHIHWLLNPSDLPKEMIIALGANPTGELIVGMAVYTGGEWSLKGKSPDSCLLPIGRFLNKMLVEAGEPPFGEFN
jgi:hypothetical protein